jgi:hypothetical protein
MRKSIAVFLLAAFAAIRLQRRMFLVFAALLCLPVVAQSALIKVGSHELLPNTANQRVQIFISGNDMINADNLAASVGTGNQFNLPNDVDGPAITGNNVIGGGTFTNTIFTGNNLGNAVSGATGPTKRTVENGTNAANGSAFDENGDPTAFFSVLANGLFGTLTFDTTGIFAGPVQKTWQLLMGQFNNVPLGFGTSDIGTDPLTNKVVPTIIDGTVFIPTGELDRPPDGPEPASIVLALFAAAALAAVAIRRRRCG